MSKTVGGGMGEDIWGERIERHWDDDGVVMTRNEFSNQMEEIPISNIVNNMSMSCFDMIPSNLSSIRGCV